MDVTKEGLIAQRRNEVLAERDEAVRWGLLQAALLRFNIIPEHREAQVRGASWDQIKVWYTCLRDAPDLDSVFDENDNTDFDD